jgi:hypothetical protein
VQELSVKSRIGFVALGRWAAMPAKDETTIWQNDNDETTQKQKNSEVSGKFQKSAGCLIGWYSNN